MREIRAAREDDYSAFVELVPELRVDDPIPSRERWVAELVPSTLVVEEVGVVIAYAWYQTFADEGIVRNIVVAPHAQGRGIGQALLVELARALRAQGIRRWALNVKPDNLPALALYRKLGFVQAFRSVALRFDWSLLDTLPSAPALKVVVLEPEADARAEADQRLPRGFLATHRALAGRVIYAVESEKYITGVTVFVPLVPGAFPLRADTLEVAQAILREVRSKTTSAVMNVFIEGQPEIAEGFVIRGATVRLDILHLKGDVPGDTVRA